MCLNLVLMKSKLLINASKPSCDQDNSNTLATAISNVESLLLDDCLVQNQSQIINLNSRPKYLKNQAFIPNKVWFKTTIYNVN